MVVRIIFTNAFIANTVFSGVRVAKLLDCCAVSCRGNCLSFGHCIVLCFDLWLLMAPLYLQTILIFAPNLKLFNTYTWLQFSP
jgi:hypothetical protein